MNSDCRPGEVPTFIAWPALVTSYDVDRRQFFCPGGAANGQAASFHQCPLACEKLQPSQNNETLSGL